MTELIDTVIALATDQLDLLLIISIVVFVQGLKKAVPKLPKKMWMLVNIATGFLAAWLITPSADMRALIRTGLIYSAGAELAYQGWRAITDSVKTRLKK